MPAPADTAFLGREGQSYCSLHYTCFTSKDLEREIKVLSSVRQQTLKHGFDFLSEVSWKTKLLLEEIIIHTSIDHTRDT